MTIEDNNRLVAKINAGRHCHQSNGWIIAALVRELNQKGVSLDEISHLCGCRDRQDLAELIQQRS
jgi:hypothetical protein